MMTSFASSPYTTVDQSTRTRRNVGGQIERTNRFENIDNGLVPFKYTKGVKNKSSLNVRDAVVLCQKAYYNFAVFRNVIDLMTEFSSTNIYFTGVPSPGAAGLSPLPVFIVFEFDIFFFRDPYFNIVNLIIIGFLMVSKIPTFDIKSINFKTKYSPWIILIIAVICVGLLSNVWMSLVILGFTYIISIIYTIIKNLNIKY